MRYEMDCGVYRIPKNQIIERLGKTVYLKGPSRAVITFSFKDYDTKKPPLSRKDFNGLLSHDLTDFIKKGLLKELGCQDCKNTKMYDIQVSPDHSRGIFNVSFAYNGPRACFGRRVEGIIKHVPNGDFIPPLPTEDKARKAFNGEMHIDIEHSDARQLYRKYKDTYGKSD